MTHLYEHYRVLIEDENLATYSSQEATVTPISGWQGVKGTGIPLKQIRLTLHL